ncbi:MAG: hypothetical protein KA974_03915 [Saprospiraceae bacterium]|nr:hypothetical protein [Saprospiraceae bacterium]MBP7680093.1 hypothetical protein [Saprospiraceae bacterium]
MKIFLIGFMASGKTTIGSALAHTLALPFIDLDYAIETHYQRTITELFTLYGEATFRQIEQQTLHNIISHNDDFVLATGGGTPCFYDNMDVMNQSGATIFMSLNKEILIQRLSHIENVRPLLHGLAEMELRTEIERLLKKRSIFYLKSRFIISITNQTVNEIVLDIIKEINLPRG